MCASSDLLMIKYLFKKKQTTFSSLYSSVNNSIKIKRLKENQKEREESTLIFLGEMEGRSKSLSIY